MIKTKISKFITIILVTFALFSTANCVRIPIVNNMNDIEQSLQIGDELIASINKFKEHNNRYPNKLEELVPEYLKELPKTKMKKLDDATKTKYVYREFSYGSYYRKSSDGSYNNEFGIDFDVSLDNRECYGTSSDGCANRVLYRSERYNQSAISKDLAGMYKGWYYHAYKCNKTPNPLECKFKSQLNSKYQQTVTVK